MLVTNPVRSAVRVRSRLQLLTFKQTIMKEFLKIMGKDIMKEKFTTKEYIIYGTIYPLALIIIMCIAGWLETL